jgi:penicillin-binding protein 1A
VYESYAIGSNTVNPLQMAGAYSAFGNGGVYNKPHFVQKVVLANGKVVDFAEKPKRVMMDYTAYMVTDMLRTVVDAGTGTNANVPGLDVAGKTGTTNFDQKTSGQYGYPYNATNDSWFAGYTPQYTMAVWTGYEQNGQGNYMVGNTTKIAHYMFKSMMQTFGTDSSSFKQPNSVYRVRDELYIKGVGSAEVPIIPKINHEKKSPKTEKNKGKEKKHSQKENGKNKGKAKGKEKGKKKEH